MTDHQNNGMDDQRDQETAVLEIRSVTKRYGSVTAVRDASLQIAPGELVGITGPNGSGKTTLGRIAVGLTPPTSGSVSRPTNVGYGFQNPRYYPNLTAEEHIEVFAAAMGNPPRQWIESLLETLRLDRVAHQPARDLSGGFKKKLDIAIALLERPTLVWLDEPLANLDRVSIDRIVALLEEYVAKDGAVVVSTHNFDPFEEVVTKQIAFYDGKRVR